MSSQLGYKVQGPNELYQGKGYCDWICDWFNWFLSADADKHTHGPVVFLRSLGLPNRLTGAYIPDVPGQVSGSSIIADPLTSELGYSKAYVNDPNIRIAGDRLQIFSDQAVLIPIIVAYELASSPYKDWGSLQEFTGFTIDYGDNPPAKDQLTIDGTEIKLPENLLIHNFRFLTSIFTAIIPDTDYGRSVKDFLEIKVAPGVYPAMVEGYFVLVKFNSRKQTYMVHSYASGPRELTGVYFSDLYYEIEVSPRPEPRPPSLRIPPRNERILSLTLSKIMESQELNNRQVSFLMGGKDLGKETTRAEKTTRADRNR
jgi:hypothetical protein